MSDAYYQEQAARRNRRLLIVGGLVVILACLIAGGASLFYDACTKSFDRSPEAVVSTYVDALKRGDPATSQECWEHEAYYDLEAGCSEVCLSRLVGAKFDVTSVTVGEPESTPEGRANLTSNVAVTCSEDGDQQIAEIVLDSVGGVLPWKHWAIVHSTFGGTVAEQWCK